MTGILAWSEGMQAGREMDQKNALAELAIAQGNEELIKTKAANAAQTKLLAALSQAETSAPQGNLATPNTDALADQMDGLAQIYMKSGLPEKAREYATAGVTLRKNTAEIADKQVDVEIKRANAAASIFANVKDQQTWEQANNVFELQMGIPSKYKSLPYDPNLVNQIQQGIQSIKDRALTDAAEARKKASLANAAEDATRIDLLRAQIENTQARTDALRKNGAGTTVDPKAGDVKIITDMMNSEFGASLIPEEARVRSRPIAERMLQIVKEQNVTKTQAAQIAYEEAKQAGDLAGLRQRPPRAGSQDKPLEIPRLKTGEVDRSKMVDNRWYTVRGEPMLLMNGKLYSKDMLGDNNPDEEEEP